MLSQTATKLKYKFGILEKINIHQQYRYLHLLYKKPVKNTFKSEIHENNITTFSNATLMIGAYDSKINKLSSINWFVRNRIFMRHQNYLTNQWWNGQLPEHNAEITYLSDIDWRYTFVENIGDLLLDFPDADQHYNPRQRRWFSKHQKWFDYEKTILSEIYSHYIYEAFIKAYNYYEKNREILDIYTFKILKNSVQKIQISHETLLLSQRFTQYSISKKKHS